MKTNGKYKKGQSGNLKGRPKGVPNKTTEQVREAFKALLDDNLEQLKDDLSVLDPKDRIRYVLDIARFILPTLKSTELKAVDNKITKIVRVIVGPEDNLQPTNEQ